MYECICEGSIDLCEGWIQQSEKAEQLLDSMEKWYNEEKDWRIKPDIISIVLSDFNNTSTFPRVNQKSYLL